MAVEDARHLERVDWSPRHDVDADAWPFALPAVAQLIHDGGLDIPGGVTFLVGENGSGKSTLVEALAQAFPRSGAAPATGPPASELVASWRDFLTAPSRYLQHLLGHDTDPATQR